MTAIQSPFQATAGTAASLNVLTTAGDLLFENSTPANSRLPLGAAGAMLGQSAGLPAWLPAMERKATTGATGYTMINGTGNIVTWTAPNDGNLHSVAMQVVLHVSSNETGGDINLSFTSPDGSTKVTDFIGPTKTIDSYACDFPQWQRFITAPAGVVTLAQNSALTGGASVCYAEIWAS